MMPFDASSFSASLGTRFLGQSLFYYPSLPSTMDRAKALAEEGAAEGMAVLAGEQTAGRGRLGRNWLSPLGNIALSILLRPSLERLPSLVMIASVAMVHAIEEVTGLRPAIKWPNDILLRGKKVCGILIEAQFQGDAVAYAIVGIGLNVNADPSALPHLTYPATSLRAELGKEVSLPELLRRLLQEIESLYLVETALVFEEWRGHLETLGRRVRVRGHNIIEEGIAEAIDSTGSLLLRRPDGSLSRIAAGDVTLS